jgi:hypothetical protein
MKFIFNAVIVCASCFSMMGCAAVIGDLPNVSAGLTGCPPHTIAIQDENMGYYNDTWTAKCEGRTFYCSRTVVGKNTTCTEAMINNK